MSKYPILSRTDFLIHKSAPIISSTFLNSSFSLLPLSSILCFISGKKFLSCNIRITFVFISKKYPYEWTCSPFSLYKFPPQAPVSGFFSINSKNSKGALFISSVSVLRRRIYFAFDYAFYRYHYFHLHAYLKTDQLH